MKLCFGLKHILLGLDQSVDFFLPKFDVVAQTHTLNLMMLDQSLNLKLRLQMVFV
jgi:hypothetical protein